MTADESWADMQDEVVAALERHDHARDQLLVVDAWTSPTVINIAARHLARRGACLTPSELRDELAACGHRVPATQLKAAMTVHRAFVRLPGDRYVLGQPVGLSIRTGG